MNNSAFRTISVTSPDRNSRKLYFEWINHGENGLQNYSCLGDDDYIQGSNFIATTEGLQIQEIEQILTLAKNKNIASDDINTAFRLYKYGIAENPWRDLEANIIEKVESNLDRRVKGQTYALHKVKTVVKRAVKGLSGLQHSGNSHKPKGILFFAGPTGVGKTETAKALAESIFGDENSCVRFDMSEYREENSDQRLFGAPPGYVGYQGGGQLTNAVKNRPFSVLLFDEIEKASPTVLDKFLQILEDGRMTDNQGNTVYFGDTIIIFTSNIGLTREATEQELMFSTTRRIATISIEDPLSDDSPEFQQKVTDIVTEGVKSYFTDIGRPELLNRLGDNNIVVFQFIDKFDAEIICEYKLTQICENIKSNKDINIEYGNVLNSLKEKAVAERANGGRGIGNMLEREFSNPLAEYLCELLDSPMSLTCHDDNGSIAFEVK
jgi:ATP-dependent Clp protease ATP-binding subunit ClpA